MSTLAAIKRARETLTPDGAWIQGYYRGTRMEDGTIRVVGLPTAPCHCLVGAIYDTGMDVLDKMGAITQVCLTLGLNVMSCYDESPENQLIRWNDAPGRTQAEVLDALDRSASGGEHDASA